MVRQVPVVWHALADQCIDEARAKVIVEVLRYQAASWGGPVQDAVVDALAARGAGWAGAGCPPTTLRQRLEAALIAADPAAADRRRELRTRGADVRVQGTGDGLADLRTSCMDAADARLVRAQIDAYAQRIKADGDDRPIGQIRVAVVIALITRPWEAQDPAVAHLSVHADLADLLLPDLTDLIDTPDPGPDPDLGPGPDRDLDPDADRDLDPGLDLDLDLGPVDSQTGTGSQAATATGETDDPRPRMAAPGTGPTAPDARTRHPAPPPGTGVPAGGQVGFVDGLPVSPAAVRALLERIDALGLTHPDGGTLDITIGHRGRLLAVATPDELTAAAKDGRGLGPPPATTGYTPTAAQYRYLRARDRHCRFPGCRRVASSCEADHVQPYDHTHPTTGGPTCVRNLTMLCTRHHRLKTHAPGWRFTLDPDGTLHVTTPGGTTRTTRPPAADQVLDLMTPAAPRQDPADDPPPF